MRKSFSSIHVSINITVACLLTIVLANEANAIVCPTDFTSEQDITAFIKKRGENALSLEREFDINKDGKNDILIGENCGNSGCNYHVFLRTADGKLRYSGNGFFHKDAFKVIHTAGDSFEILAYVRANQAEGNLVRYRSYACGEFEKLAEIKGDSVKLFSFVKEFLPRPM